MWTKIRSFVTVLALAMIFLPMKAGAVSSGVSDHADEELNSVYMTNPDTGYVVIVDDKADLVDSDETRGVIERMYEVTAYGGAAFVTTASNSGTTSSYAQQYYYSVFGEDSGVVFVIDMDNREIFMFTHGDIYKRLGKSYANSITDNVYTYASDGDFAGCASEAFREVTLLMAGAKIAQPMKYVSNFLIAISLALLINYGIVSGMSGLKKASNADMLSTASSYVVNNDVHATFLREDRRYSPQSSGSSGGGGGSRGGGGGGHSGGGGGGHRF